MVSLQAAVLALALGGAGQAELLDFSASWCGPCRQMEPVVDALAQQGYPVRKVNIDHDRALAAQYKVEGIPCFVLVVNGREVARESGVLSRDQLERMMMKAGVTPGGLLDPNILARANTPEPSNIPRIPMPGVVSDRPMVNVRAAAPAPVPAPAPGMSNPNVPAQVTQHVLAATVRLKVHDARGNDVASGTIIDSRAGEALIVTCGHVFRDSQGKGEIFVDLYGPGAPQGLPGKLISYDDKADVGIVSIRPGMPVTAARLAPPNYTVRSNDPVINVGCDHGADATAHTSHVTGVDKILGPPNLQVAGQPVQGRSGGGLFTAEGQMIGVCNAADPTDNAGLYAALASVHRELDKVGISDVLGTPSSPEIALARAAAPPPPMPRSAPVTLASSSSPAFATTAVPSPVAPATEAATLTPAESALLANLRQGAEVICIVRPLANSNAKSEVIVLDQASPKFLEQLAADRQAQASRHLTSYEVPNPTGQH